MYNARLLPRAGPLFPPLLAAVAPPSIEPVQGNCTDGPPSPLNSATKCFDGLWDASALFTMVSRTAAAPLLAALQAGGTPPTANFTEVEVSTCWHG